MTLADIKPGDTVYYWLPGRPRLFGTAKICTPERVIVQRFAPGKNADAVVAVNFRGVSRRAETEDLERRKLAYWKEKNATLPNPLMDNERKFSTNG